MATAAQVTKKTNKQNLWMSPLPKVPAFVAGTLKCVMHLVTDINDHDIQCT